MTNYQRRRIRVLYNRLRRSINRRVRRRWVNAIQPPFSVWWPHIEAAVLRGVKGNPMAEVDPSKGRREWWDGKS